MTTPAPTGIEHIPTVRKGIVGPGEPGHRVFEANYVVECPCGFKMGCSTLDVKDAYDAAARHLYDVTDPYREVMRARDRLVGGQSLIVEARLLRSEDGENPEYDRALVELVTRVLGLSHDEHGDIMKEMILQ